MGRLTPGGNWVIAPWEVPAQSSILDVVPSNVAYPTNNGLFQGHDYVEVLVDAGASQAAMEAIKAIFSAPMEGFLLTVDFSATPDLPLSWEEP